MPPSRRPGTPPGNGGHLAPSCSPHGPAQPARRGAWACRRRGWACRPRLVSGAAGEPHQLSHQPKGGPTARGCPQLSGGGMARAGGARGAPGRPKLLRGAVRWGLEARPRPKVAATSRSFYAVGLILRIRGRHNVPICYIQYRIHTLDSSTCGRQFWSPTPLTKTVVVIQVAGCVSHRAPALPRPLRVAGDAPLGGARDAGSSARRAGVEARSQRRIQRPGRPALV